MSRAFDELKPYLDRAMALNTALVLFEWDNETLAPEQAGSLTGNVIGILSGEYFQAVNNDQVIRLAEACSRENDLTKAEAAQVRELLKEIEKLSHIPRNMRGLQRNPPGCGPRQRMPMTSLVLLRC